ncbi:MAG: hypothetical protein M1339_04630 [Bacteroidetes bacterium]|nr:hypothetical protein [Bacteroidota bacterium]
MKNTDIPANLSDEVIDFAAETPLSEVFNVRESPNFTFEPLKISFNKSQCDICSVRIRML